MEKIQGKTYDWVEKEKAQQDILEEIKQMLGGSKGYTIAVLANKNDKTEFLNVCGGKLCIEMLARQLAKTTIFYKEIAQASLGLKGEECHCQDCQAKRMEHKPSSNFVH